MASHGHPTTTSSRRCCCCSTSHHPPPPHQLIIHCQSIHPTPPPPQSHLISPPYSSFNPKAHHQQQETQYYYYPPQTHKQKSQSHRYHHQYHQEEEEEQHINPTITSLLRRISALESSIFQRSSISFPLRNAAARTIQTHFRAFLVRRSRALRLLKDLAFIKSALNTLKCNHSNNTHCDSRALSHKAMYLLNKLDSIQSGDPMIRDSKRSISRELIRFMDYLDDLSMKRDQLLSGVLKNVKLGGTGTKSRVFQSDQKTSIADCRGLKEERDLLEKLKKRVEKIEGFSRVSEEDQEKDVELENPRTDTNGKPAVSQTRTGVLKKRHAGVQARAKKNVSFAENGNVYMVYRSVNGPDFIGECNSIDGSDSIDAEELGREVEEIGTGDDEEIVHTDDNESPQTSDDDRDPRRDLFENDDGSFVFSAPLSVKMEPRANMRSKKKAVKILN